MIAGQPPGAAAERARVARELAAHTPFDRVEPEHLAWLAERIEIRHHAAGTAILTPGTHPDRLRVLRSGAVQLEAMGQVAAERKIIAEVAEGESFPIEALHERRPVFSTFRAVRDCSCLELARDDFWELQERSPAFRAFCEHRSRGLLENTRRIYQAYYEHESNLATPTSKLMVAPRATCGPETPLREALEAMRAAGARSVVVLGPERALLGVFGVDDLLDRVVGGGGLDVPISACMRQPAATIAPEELAGEAALVMARAGRGEVLVVDAGRLAGVLSERQLVDLQRIGVGEIGAAIRSARDVKALAEAAQDVQLLAYDLVNHGVAAAQLTRLVSTLNDRITERLVEMEASRAGVADVAFCWVALGSEGRLEQTLWTDQDNGIAFDPAGADPEEVRGRLLPFAERVNAALAECGFPRCKGNVMAGNPECCLAVDEWSRRFARWLDAPGPEELLKASIYFDLRAVWGRRALVEALQARLLATAPKRSRFLALLAQSAAERAAPLGFFRDFVVEDHREHPGTVDLKLGGIALFVDAARVLALANGVAATSTERRLREAGERAGVPKAEVDGWTEAFHYVQVLRLRHQHELVRAGKEPHNRIDPNALNAIDRRLLVESLRQATRLQKRISAAYAGGGAF